VDRLVVCGARADTPARSLKRVFGIILLVYRFPNTVTLLEDLGVERSRVAVHNWVQKADLQPAGGGTPDRVAVDQKAIRINNKQYWLYAAVDPQTNRILHSRLFPTYMIAIARKFLAELAEKHDVINAVFLVDDLIGALRRGNYSYRVQQHGFRNSVERVFREVQRRTSSFSNCFSHVDPATAETWLQTHAVCGIMLRLTRPIDQDDFWGWS